MSGTVIAFPVREPPDDDIPVEDPPDWEEDPVIATCVDCGTDTDDHHVDCPWHVPDPAEIVEAGGRWVWQEAGAPPDDETPVGMVAHQIRTSCRWAHLHYEREEPTPQPCCYSVLVTTKRLPGPVRTERSWLAASEEDPS